MCAEEDSKGSCYGDNGGALVVVENGRYTVVGVVMGFNCKSTSVFTKVTAGKDWILATTQGTQDSNCDSNN